MYRLLSASKDAYITNKYILNTRSLDANTGQAGTLDLFKLYNETYVTSSTNILELSRLLIQFDLSPLQALTSSILNPATGSFTAILKLKDVYGGQTVPSNFTVSLFPLAKTFTEGRGFDVRTYKDIDVVNWGTASLDAGIITTWVSQGADSSGTLGVSNIDYYVSGNLGSGVQSLEVRQTFARGDEDLSMDITSLVSASIVGILPSYGWRLSFSNTEEADSVTRFVKRFGSRHTFNKDLHPKLHIKYNNVLQDDSAAGFLDITNNLYIYNRYNGISRQFYSGSVAVTGSNSLVLQLIASKSVIISTSSYFDNFSASITYTTSSYSYLSSSFFGSQATIGGLAVSGVYYAPVLFNLQASSSLRTFLGDSDRIGFKSIWSSLDGTVSYTTGSYITLKRIVGTDNNVLENNLVVNVTNLKSLYTSLEVVRFRTFVQDYNTEVIAYRAPTQTKPAIFKTMYWRIVDAFSRKVVIPFDTIGTLLSTDNQGMYFDFYMSDLEVNTVYELEFQITENGKDFLVTNQGFRFKVMS